MRSELSNQRGHSIAHFTILRTFLTQARRASSIAIAKNKFVLRVHRLNDLNSPCRVKNSFFYKEKMKLEKKNSFEQSSQSVDEGQRKKKHKTKNEIAH